jgi:hypothetical protein
LAIGPSISRAQSEIEKHGTEADNAALPDGMHLNPSNQTKQTIQTTAAASTTADATAIVVTSAASTTIPAADKYCFHPCHHH